MSYENQRKRQTSTGWAEVKEISRCCTRSCCDSSRHQILDSNWAKAKWWHCCKAAGSNLWKIFYSLQFFCNVERENERSYIEFNVLCLAPLSIRWETSPETDVTENVKDLLYLVQTRNWHCFDLHFKVKHGHHLPSFLRMHRTVSQLSGKELLVSSAPCFTILPSIKDKSKARWRQVKNKSISTFFFFSHHTVSKKLFTLSGNHTAHLSFQYAILVGWNAAIWSS